MTIVSLLVIAIVICRLVDYTKCPHCHLADAKALSKEYWEIERAKQKRTISVSSVDELKNFKELIDICVITQEQFDAKKKQLFGL